MNYPVLLIDTSTRWLIFARLEADGSGITLCRQTGNRGEDTIDAAIGELFPVSEDIREIWLGAGPGSFVGLRSSFAYCRMYAMLAKIPCRTFVSSRLWRLFFGVSNSDWFLTRTNQRLYYADRFSPEREAFAVDAGDTSRLSGDSVVCFAESWQAAQTKSTDEKISAWRYVSLADAQITHQKLNAENLALSADTGHDRLVPIYGHELNFVLAKGNNG